MTETERGSTHRDRGRREPIDRPLVLWRAGTRWDSLAGTDRQLVAALGDHVDLLWIDPPRSVMTRRPGDRLLPHLESGGPGVRRLSIAVPPMPHRRWMFPVTEAWVRACVRRVLRADGRQASAVVSTSPFTPLDVSRAPTRVYYATDAYGAGADLLGRDPAWLHELERRRMHEATHVGAVSGVITDGWPGDRPTFVLPNGANTAHYADIDSAPLPVDVAIEGPVAGVVGHLSARIDLDILESVAARSLTLLLVGPRVEDWGGERFETLVRRPNVVWVGNKTYAELPSYLRLMDVGLTPYVTSDFNQASSPLKTLEYLAAGRAALSTPLPGVTALDTDLVECAATPDVFAHAAERLAHLGRDAGLVHARQEFARAHDWASRALQLLEVLGLPARGSVTTDSR